MFASAAAVGAGLQVVVDHHLHVGHIGGLVAGWTVAVPVAIYVLMVWLLQVRVCPREYGPVVTAAFPLTALLVLATPLSAVPVPATAVLLAGLVAV